MATKTRRQSNASLESRLSTLEDKTVHEILLQGGNGYGSTGTAQRRFASIVKNSGTAVVYADSAVSGGSFTITKRGIYAVRYSDIHSGGGLDIGISKNQSNLAAGLNSQADSETLVIFTLPSANQRATGVWIGELAINDVIRASSNGSPANGTDNKAVRFHIVLLKDLT